MQHGFNRRSVIQLAAARRPSRSLFLGGVSAVALLLASHGAVAKSLNSGPTPSPTTTAINTVQQGSQQAADAVQRARAALSRTTQAIQAIQAAQAAARNLALGAPSSVPNGLVTGGLDPAVAKPSTNTASPYPASQDPTGTQTWDGAYYPTQTISGSGKVDVNIKQIQTNAILSWNTFNIGRDTTLTFDQQGHTNWVALNRVVGNDMAPSQILGNVKADGMVLVINQNGIIFNGSSQINVGSLIASTLDVGANSNNSTGTSIQATIAQRNQIFMQYGLLGNTNSSSPIFSTTSMTPTALGDVQVAEGASIATNGTDGLVLMMGHRVINDGYLSSPAGQVALLAGSQVAATKGTGASDSTDPNVRGLFFSLFLPNGVTSINNLPPSDFYVWNQADGLIQANQGNITLKSFDSFSYQVNMGGNIVGIPVEGGAIVNDGVLYATTSVSRNGSILMDGADIRLSSNSVVAIPPDTGGATIPQDPTSLSQFKQSEIIIGSGTTNIDMQSNALLYAPAANVIFGDKTALGGVPSSITSPPDTRNPTQISNIFIDDGAVIDVAGMPDVEVPASRNEVVISPVKGNELRDSPLFRVILNGATVYLDPRLSGVRADGVAWIGSPLIDAASYYQLVGVGPAELMTKGGTVSFGNGSYVSSSTAVSGANASSLVIKSGAVIDISGGWVSYQGGAIRQTQLITADGHIVSIGKADPNGITLAFITASRSTTIIGA